MSENALVRLVDDDKAVSDALAICLMAGGYDVAVFDSARAFLNSLSDTRPGCIVTDLRLPDINGIGLMRTLREIHNPLPVIVITGFGYVEVAVEAMKLGATDFLEKPVDCAVLRKAVAAALARNAHKPADNRNVEIDQRLSNLTKREREVLLGVVSGKANKVIAMDLEISPRTVEFYRANLMTKMKADSLAELVRMALAVGLIHREM